MIDFVLNDAIPFNYYTESELEEARQVLKSRTDKILEDLEDIKQDKFTLGCHLIALFQSKAWSADPGLLSPTLSLDGKYRGYRRTFAFMEYCEKHFGLDKSQVSRYMNIVDEFGDRFVDYKDEYKDFKYSQLVEMLSLTEEQRRDITPQMTVAEIRTYKKKLVATSQQTEDKSKDMPKVQSEPQPKETVATSQQKEKHIIWSTDFGDVAAKDIFKYIRFFGKSSSQLCDMYLELEEKYNKLKASLDIKNKSEVPA